MAGHYIDPMHRFWRKVSIDPNTGCWLWLGCPNGAGYGAIKIEGRWIKAHRFAYEQFVGPIPDGMDMAHTCDVKLCVNPNHVRPTTRAVNVQERWERNPSRARIGILKTEQVERVIDLLQNSDKTFYEICDETGAKYQTIVHINSGYHWSDVLPHVSRPIRISKYGPKREAA